MSMQPPAPLEKKRGGGGVLVVVVGGGYKCFTDEAGTRRGCDIQRACSNFKEKKNPKQV